MNRLREIVGRRWVRVVLAGVLLPLPLFVLLCNVLLWTGAVEAIVTRDGKATTLRLEHGFAWMLWPTRVHIHEAHLEIDAYSYQLALDVDEALVDMRLLSLFERRAHFETISATGVRAEYRVKLHAEDANNPELAAYPGFDDTPVQVKANAPKAIPAADEAWGVDLDDIDAQVDALWIDEFHFDPGGAIAGGMHWTDGHDFEVTPTHVNPDRATLWLGEHEAVRDLVGTGSLSIARFDSSAVEGDAIPGYLALDFRGEGLLVDPAGLTIWWPDLAGLVAGSPGPIEIDVAATDGVLAPGSRVHHHTAYAAVGPWSSYLTAAADLVLAIEQDGRPSATVTLADTRLRGAAGELARAAAVHGYVLLAHGDMTRPWELERTHVETGEVVASDLRKLSSLARTNQWKITRGRARGHGILDIGADEIPTARFDLALDDAAITIGSLRLAASLDTRGRVRRWPSGEVLADELSARTSALAIHTDHGDSRGTWVRVHDTQLRYREGELRVEGRAKIEDARPVIVHLTHLDPVIDAVPDLGRIESISAHGKLLVRADLVEIEILDAEQLGLHVASLWRKHGEQWRLAIWLSGLTAFGFTATEDQKVRRPLVLVGKQWYETQRRWVRQLGTPRQG